MLKRRNSKLKVVGMKVGPESVKIGDILVHSPYGKKYPIEIIEKNENSYYFYSNVVDIATYNFTVDTYPLDGEIYLNRLSLTSLLKEL